MKRSKDHLKLSYPSVALSADELLATIGQPGEEGSSSDDQTMYALSCHDAKRLTKPWTQQHLIGSTINAASTLPVSWLELVYSKEPGTYGTNRALP